MDNILLAPWEDVKKKFKSRKETMQRFRDKDWVREMGMITISILYIARLCPQIAMGMRELLRLNLCQMLVKSVLFFNVCNSFVRRYMAWDRLWYPLKVAMICLF